MHEPAKLYLVCEVTDKLISRMAVLSFPPSIQYLHILDIIYAVLGAYFGHSDRCAITSQRALVCIFLMLLLSCIPLQS